MSTSTKTPASIRHGGPGASHKNAKERPHIRKPTADDPLRRHSRVSGGGGERDVHRGHRPSDKGGGSHPQTKER
jgi:hypothetical protein